MNITLEDSTTEKITPLLETLAQDVINKSKCCDSLQKDLLFAVIIVSMIENGFCPLKSAGKLALDVDSKRLWKWKNPSGVLEADFVLLGFNDIPVTLVISPLGPTAVVNLLIEALNSETYTVCIPVSRYVVSPQAANVPRIFRDLKHLSNILKNKITAPVRSRIVSLCGYPSASLLGIPEEVYYRITLLLPVNDLAKLSQTCNRLRLLNENQSLWRSLCYRDFKREHPTELPTDGDWKSFYQETYFAKQDERQRRTAGTLHDFMDYSDLVAHIDNPLWDSMII